MFLDFTIINIKESYCNHIIRSFNTISKNLIHKKVINYWAYKSNIGNIIKSTLQFFNNIDPI